MIIQDILKWCAEHYGSIVAIASGLLASFLFLARWIKNAIRSVILGNHFYDNFTEEPSSFIRKKLAWLREENHKLSIRLDIHEKYLSIGLFICEPKEGGCIWTNQYLNELFGIDSSGMLGFGWLSAMAQEDRERVYKAWLFSIENQTPYNCDYTVINQKTKEKTKVSATAIAAIDDNKNIVCYVGYITECK